MRAAVVNGPGQGPVCAEFAEPEPGPGDQVLTLVGAGVHQVVRSRASGRHYSSEGGWPLVPGIDAVARSGDGRLVYTGRVAAPWGTMAERMSAPFGVELPAGADPLAVAAGMNPGMSGWLPLATRRAQLGELGTVLVLGATGMSGRMAVESALALGATGVVGAGRNRDALAAFSDPRVRTATLAGDPDADADALVTALEGRSPGLVLDYVWGPFAEAAFAAIGRQPLDEKADIEYVQIGSVGGERAALPSPLLRSRRITVRGSGLGAVSTEQLLAAAPDMMRAVADGAVRVPYREFPLSAVDAAWAFTGPERAVVVPG